MKCAFPRIRSRGSAGQASPDLYTALHSAGWVRRVSTEADRAAPGGCSSHSAPSPEFRAGPSPPAALPNSLFGPLWGVASRRRRTSFQSMTDSRAAARASASRHPRCRSEVHRHRAARRPGRPPGRHLGHGRKSAPGARTGGGGHCGECGDHAKSGREKGGK